MYYIKNTALKSIVYCLLWISLLSAESSIENIELHPKDTHHKKDYSHNVIQGIAVYGDYIFTTQVIRKHHTDTALLFNILDKNGDSLANKRLYLASHGYDLSVEKKDNSHIYLYTVGEHGNNAIRLIATLPKLAQTNSTKTAELHIGLDKNFILPKENHASTGVTLNEEKNYLVAVSRKYIHQNSHIKVTSGHINIYDKNQLLHNNSNILFHIPLIKEQEHYPIQGILMHKDTIYILSGDNKPNSKKLLVLYDKNGTMVHKYSLMRPSNELGKWKSWELEGLTIKGDYLYTTINAMDRKYEIKKKSILKLLDLKLTSSVNPHATGQSRRSNK